MAEQQEQQQGGITDVGAIANAAGKLFEFGGIIVDNLTLDKSSYLGRLKDQGVPVINDWWAGHKTDFTKQNQTIILALITVIGVLVIAAAISGKK